MAQGSCRARAAAVVRYLVERLGLAAACFRYEGHGVERLLEGLAPNAAAHRRVEIVVFAPPRDAGAAAEADMFGADSFSRVGEENGGDGDDGAGYRAIE